MGITYQNSALETLLANLDPAVPTMCFIQDGILIDSLQKNPVLRFQDITQRTTLHIESAFLKDGSLTLKCQAPQDPEELQAAHLTIVGIKGLLINVAPHLQATIIKAYHWLQWNNQSQYCGQCGHSLENTYVSSEKKCGHCKKSFFPRFSPAIMVLIQRKNEILLARSPHFTKGVYSAIAGFVDLGETAEMAVHREVEEEIGIKITDLEYFCTQTWPFPDSFMIAFKAKYLSGDITVDTNELEEAAWFSLDNLPELPNTASIARKLIDSVLR